MSNDADIALPARWGPLQRRKNTLLLWALRSVAAAVRRLPRPLVSPLAALVGNIVFAATLPWQRPWLAQIEAALGSEAQPRRILRRMFVHLTRSALELGHLAALAAEAQATPGSLERLQQAARTGGAVVISGHIGHWELLAQWGALHGLPIASVAKPLYDPRLTAWVNFERSRSGLELIWRGRDDGPQALLRALRAGKLLAMLIDQDTRVPGVFVPFFGRPAHTPSAPARLALKRNAPVLIAYTHRVRGQHRIHVEMLDERNVELLDVQGDAEQTQDARVYRMLAAANHKLEQAILQHPEQWVWLHRRWRREPPVAATAQGDAYA